MATIKVLQFSIKAHVLPNITEESLKSELETINDNAANVLEKQAEVDRLQEMKDSLGIGVTPWKLEKDLQAAKLALDQAKDDQQTAAIQSAGEGSAILKQQHAPETTFEYTMGVTSSEQVGLRDQYNISLHNKTPSFPTPLEKISERDHAPQFTLEETKDYTFAGQSTHQSEAFANYVLRRYFEAGFVKQPDSTGYVS